MLALLVATTPDPAARAWCLLAFGAGTTTGMVLVSSGLWLLVRAASTRGRSLVTGLRLGSAAASIVVGAFVAARMLRHP